MENAYNALKDFITKIIYASLVLLNAKSVMIALTAKFAHQDIYGQHNTLITHMIV